MLTLCSIESVFDLHRRTGHRPIGAEHATIAALGLQLRAAAGAFVEVPASVGRHRFQFRGAAARTGNDRLKDHNIQLFRRGGLLLAHQ
jgi:hypothetical protein